MKASDLNIHLESIQWLMKSLHAEIKKLEVQVLTDDLTGLLRRNPFSQRANEFLAKARETGRNASMMLIDIDHFKKINDQLGHAEGDEVLRGVARFLKQFDTDSSVVGRFGGEEFVMCAVGSERELEAKAEMIRRGIESLGGDRNCTVSIGVAHTNLFGFSEEILLEAADKALYRAKGSGRNNVQRAA